MYQLPSADKSKLYRKAYYLPLTSLEHVLEKHYYKIVRHPGCGKFTIDIANIVYWIKEAFHTEPQGNSGSLNFRRCMDTGTVIGYNGEEGPYYFYNANNGCRWYY